MGIVVILYFLNAFIYTFNDTDKALKERVLMNMRKFVMLSCISAVIAITGTVKANDLHEYKFVGKDGRVAVINDKDYTEVYRKNIDGRDVRVAFKIVPKDKDTDIYMVRTNANLDENWEKQYYPQVKRTVNPENPSETITELAKPILRDLYMYTRYGATKLYNITKQKMEIGSPFGQGTDSIVLVNNAVHIQPSDEDTSLDLAKASIKVFGGQSPVTVDKKDPSWWTDYTIQNTNKWYRSDREILIAPMGKDGKWKTKKAKLFFKKNADAHVLTIGRSRKGRDESINSIYFFYGQESTQYFRLKILDDKANIVFNDSGLHVADGNTDMFGLGVHKIKTFDSGWYGEALCQYALFNRHIHTVNDGIYGSQKANVQGKDIALSLGIGRKINLVSDWSVQPEVQYTYHIYNQHPYTDSLQREFNRKDMRDREIRTGVKVQYKWIYAKINKFFGNYPLGKSETDMEKEIGIERHINKNYDLKTSWSSISSEAGKNRETGKIYKNSQNRFAVMLKKYF